MKLMQEAKQTSGVPTEAMKKVLHEKKIRNGELMGKTNWEMETINSVNFIFSNNCSSSCSNQIYIFQLIFLCSQIGFFKDLILPWIL